MTIRNLFKSGIDGRDIQNINQMHGHFSIGLNYKLEQSLSLKIYLKNNV